MSINHNRIKVSDIETNEPNKILITNENGELEFNDLNEISTKFTQENFQFTGSKIFNLAQEASSILSVVIDGITLNGVSGAPLQYRMNNSTELEILEEMIIGEDKWVCITYNLNTINNQFIIPPTQGLEIKGTFDDNQSALNAQLTLGDIYQLPYDGICSKLAVVVENQAPAQSITLTFDDVNNLASSAGIYDVENIELWNNRILQRGNTGMLFKNVIINGNDVTLIGASKNKTSLFLMGFNIKEIKNINIKNLKSLNVYGNNLTFFNPKLNTPLLNEINVYSNPINTAEAWNKTEWIGNLISTGTLNASGVYPITGTPTENALLAKGWTIIK